MGDERADKRKKKKKKKKTLWKRFSRWFQKKVGPTLGPPVGALIVRAFSLTMKKEVHGYWPFIEAVKSDRPVVVAFWHGRLLMLPVFYERYIPYEIHVLISLHTDGEIISKLIEKFGIFSVRGSSRRGGKAAGMRIGRMLKRGHTIGFTPDGPRGPGREVKRGVIELAHMAKAVIFPVSYAAGRQFKLWTWDGFIIPMPFSKLVFVVGEPIELDGGESPEKREALRAELARRLDDAGEKAERIAKTSKK